MKISTLLLLACSALFATVEAQRRCYAIHSYGHRQWCERCRRGYRFVPGGGQCDPWERCCRGRCCMRPGDVRDLTALSTIEV
ncbi:hypothetical protein BDV25DRAFT_159788 [Aspergillus avenaceus]|uniref:Uncharacterized protein n=1 Tax=Aspergillus avenaceus TaxID=36643 RepID=A0A5N6TN05_ASPAV|nr:hypothetical protein BDV25DRAFT_159788 [Aspergillus avenaceus]